MHVREELYGIKNLVGSSPSFLRLVKRLPLISSCDATVLITGETGTGKEVFARAIHQLSSRKNNAFLALDCGAIPVDLIENELFGHEQGAYTSATSTQKGILQECENGTLFIDEIDCLSLMAQVKLLRLLQDRQYRPLGSPRIRSANVRIIAATNASLGSLVKGGKFRRDLYYRINVISLKLLPLRERIEDIPILAEYFLKKYSDNLSKNIVKISTDAMLRLKLYSWPGNIRELEHVIERAIVFCNNDYLNSSDIEFDQEVEERHLSLREEKAQLIANFEKNYLESILTAYDGNVTRAALVAGKNRRAFIYLLKKYNIEPGRFRPNQPSTHEV